jgi:hypothetical protein
MNPKVTMYSYGTTQNLISTNYVVELSDKEIYDVKCYKDKTRASTAYKIREVSRRESAALLKGNIGRLENDKKIIEGLVERIGKFNSKKEKVSVKPIPHKVKPASVKSIPTKKKPVAISPVEETIKVQAQIATEPAKTQVPLNEEEIRENTTEGLIKAFALIINADGSFDDDEIAEFTRMCSEISFFKNFSHDSVMDGLNITLDLLNASNADTEFVDGLVNSIRSFISRDSEAMRCLVRGMFWLIKADGVETSQEIEMALRIIKAVEVPIEDVFLEGMSNCKKENQVEDDSEQNPNEVLLKDVESDDEPDAGEAIILPKENNEPEQSEGSEKPNRIIRIIKNPTIKMKIENPQ